MPLTLYAPFSDSYSGVIRALVEKHDGLPVYLYRETNNPADAGAVAVVLDLPEFVVGGMTFYVRAEGRPELVVGQRIGYIARAEPSKQDLWDRLAQMDRPIRATLFTTRDDGWGVGWGVEIADDDDWYERDKAYGNRVYNRYNDLDDEIPF